MWNQLCYWQKEPAVEELNTTNSKEIIIWQMSQMMDPKDANAVIMNYHVIFCGMV